MNPSTAPRAFRPRWLVPIAWLLALAPILVLRLHATAILPLAWSERPVGDFQPVAGFSFATPLQTRWMSRDSVGGSPAELLEDGRPLACPNPPANDTAEVGLGRYQLDGGWLFLAPSDNSDPRTNGRHYVLRWPTPPSRVVLAICLLWSGGVGLFALWSSRRAIEHLLQAPPLWVSLMLVLVPLAAHRWWFFADVPLPAIHPDSGSYYALTRLMMSGQWPHFEIRPPGYPLFLSAVLGATHSLMGLIVVQTLMTAASTCLLVYAVHRLWRPLAPWVALCLAGFITGLWSIEHDTAVLSESLYVSCIVFGAGFLILALATSRAAYFAASSAAVGLAILTRPAGLFLVVPYVFSVWFLVWNSRPRSHVFAFMLPLPLLVLSVSSYNYVTSGVFNVTAWGEANLAVATFTMWDVDPSYPADVNAKVAEVRRLVQERLTDDERAALAGSWNPDLLAPAFLKGFWQPALNAASHISADYLESRRWIRRIAIASIRSNPATYAKFVWTMSYVYYITNVRYRANFSDFITYRVRNLFTVQDALDPTRTELIGTYLRPHMPPTVSMGGPCAVTPEGVTIAQTPARRIHRLTQEMRDDVFASALWVYAFFIVLLMAVVRLAAAGGRHLGAFVVSVIGISAVAAGLLVCLVEYGGQRYAYPTEFIYSVTVALAPLLWMNLRFPAHS